MPKMTGARILIESLLAQGVDTIFGYPGGTILNVYDALYNYTDKITHILTAHEQGASHAADGYARTTGKVGVCFATSGPGATNLTTGIATAYMDSSPVVFITCNVISPLIGKDTFQEVDITGISMPITKHNYIVSKAQDIAEIVKEAFDLARSGRPGPVLIDILKDATAQKAEYSPVRGASAVMGDISPRLLRHRQNSKGSDIKSAAVKLAGLINESKRPVIMAGGGVIRSGAADKLYSLAAALGCPVTSTMMGLGAMPGDSPLFLGMIGMHGSKASNLAVSKCDLLIAIGTRFNDRVASVASRFAEQAVRVHIDIDPAEIDKNVIAHHHIIGDAGEVLTELLKVLPSRTFEEWAQEANALRQPPASIPRDGLDPAAVLKSINALAPKDSIIVTDVGQHQIWSAQHYKYTCPGTFISSGGFGTMGFGLGAAIGAKVGNPERTVVHIAGDGCFKMNCHEMATEQRYGIPVITVLMNNGVLGMVRQWQTLLYERRYSQTTLDNAPDYVMLAAAYGIKGHVAYDINGFNRAFKAALDSKAAAVIDCRIGMDELVMPMVAPGKHITEFIDD